MTTPPPPAEPLTDAELAEIKQRLAATTQGEWAPVYHGHDIGDRMEVVTDDDPSLEPEVECVLFGPKSAENWRFIMDAHNSTVPRLLSEVDRLRAANSALEAKVKQLTAVITDTACPASECPAFKTFADELDATANQMERHIPELTWKDREHLRAKAAALRAAVEAKGTDQ